MRDIANATRTCVFAACTVVCTACGAGHESQQSEGTATLALSRPASGWTQTLSSDDGVVTPLHVAVDRGDHTFVLACVGPCDAGERLLVRIDSDGEVAFSERLSSEMEPARLDVLNVSLDGRVGLAGDRVAPDGTTRMVAAVFRRDGRLEWQAHDDTPAHALDATFGAAGELVVVGAASDGSGIASAFSRRARGSLEWRFTTPNAGFSRVRSDHSGSVSIAGLIPGASGQLATAWRLHRGGRLAWTYTAPGATTGATLAVDAERNTALVSTNFRPPTPEERPLDFVTTKLDARGEVLWTQSEEGGVNVSKPLDAVFRLRDDLTVFARRQAPGRFGRMFETFRYDARGHKLWGNENDFGFASADPAAMALDPDGDVAEIGTAFADVTSPTGFLAVYRSDGSLLRTRFDPSHLVDVARDSTGGIIVLGARGASTVVTREEETGPVDSGDASTTL